MSLLPNTMIACEGAAGEAIPAEPSPESRRRPAMENVILPNEPIFSPATTSLLCGHGWSSGALLGHGYEDSPCGFDEWRLPISIFVLFEWREGRET